MRLKFKTKPWKHQLNALKYMMGRENSALYTDMGTGKTKVVIDWINNKDFKTVLIVCPKKVMDVWPAEFVKHSYNQNIQVLNTKNYTVKGKATEVKKINSVQRKNAQVVIINYESVWREPLKKELLKIKFDAVICDESHRIKSPSSKCSRFLTLIGKRVSCKVLVTGTPLAQSPLDIYAQYRFLDPTIFGTRYDDFKYTYANWVKGNGYEFLDKKRPFKNLDDLHEKMFSCAFLAESDVELPETQDIKVEFDMPPKTQQYYTEFRNESCLEFQEGVISSENVLSSILRLQQLSSGYLPLETPDKTKKVKEVDTARIDALKELLGDINPDEPIVIFCKYRKDITNIVEFCKGTKITVSEVSGKVDELQEWKDGNTRILVVQIQSGNEGIDLTRARYCIYYSLSYSLGHWKQSRKRVHRPGQTRPVVYYTIIAKHKKCKTVDEQIFEGLQRNEDIIQGIMEAREI